jgi:2-polyprenyl-3-methyl-5-hydroxy-6-metoxy-1,4-benzoquinol methylase
MTLLSCPHCAGQDLKILFKAEAFRSTFSILYCLQCGLVSTYPFPDENILHDLYTIQYYGKTKNKFLPFLQNIRDHFSKRRAKRYLSMISDSNPKVLDIGCAEGRLLNSFFECGCDCCGVEHSSYPKERFINRDRIKYFIGDINSIAFGESRFNIIILWHVLEHMNNPQSVIQKVSDLLSHDGIIIIAVPNFSGVESRMFRQSWFHLDVPWHKYHFTEKFIRDLFEKNDLQRVKATTFCLEQGVFGFLQSLLNSMGWKKNELYEAMKGSLSKTRIIYLAIQAIIFILLFMPSLLISLLTSINGNGSVLMFVLKKNNIQIVNR